MADGILTPCNVARSWHWFHQVTAPCNVACGSGIITVNSPSGSTLHCDTWLWDDIMTCHWIRPVTAPCNVTRSSGIMTLNSPGGSTLYCGRWLRDDMPLNCPNVRHIGILHLVSISTTSLQSTCHSAPVSEILSQSDHPRQKIMTSCRFSRWRI